jgi:hypothetical protein
MSIEDIYADTVKYTKYLEALLKKYTVLDDLDLEHIRGKFIKPTTNVANDWLKEHIKNES